MKADLYRMITVAQSNSFEAEVNELLRQGWELYGFPVVETISYKNPDGADQYGHFYSQALIKVKTEAPPRVTAP